MKIKIKKKNKMLVSKLILYRRNKISKRRALKMMKIYNRTMISKLKYK